MECQTFYGGITMSEIMKFENNDVEIIQDKNGEPLFEIYSTGMALGYVTVAKGKVYPQKIRIDKIVKNAEIKPVVHGVQLFINESQLYDFMLEARTDKCRIFRKWVTNEVLPSIRKTGNYSIPKTPSLPYTYIEKTFHGRPVLTASDVSNIYGINSVTLYNYIKSTLIPDRDYSLLTGDELKEYNKENPQLFKCKKSLFVIYNMGLSRIISYYELDNSKTPSFMAEKRGYVVQAGVRSVMEYVRREIKGIEALTYLIESNDSPRNLENYRKILVQKLSAISWWKCDVSLVRLGIQPVTVPILTQIHNGEYGIRY